MQRDHLPERAATLGASLTEQLSKLPHVVGVRGFGLLLGVELDVEALGRDARAVAGELTASGLLVNPVTPTALRLAPPLTIGDHHVAEALVLLEGALS